MTATAIRRARGALRAFFAPLAGLSARSCVGGGAGSLAASGRDCSMLLGGESTCMDGWQLAGSLTMASQGRTIESYRSLYLDPDLARC